MKRAMKLGSFLAALALLSFVSSASAGKYNKKLDIGDPAPDFQGLIGTDDKPHSLSDYRDAKVVVICFTCNHCPVAKAYEDRFIQFVNDYKDKGVAFVAINVNNIPADRLDKMKERAAQKGFNFDYLYDPTQKVGHAYGATVTPHLFVLDSQRRIAYMGAFDDSKNPNQVTKHYVRDAVDALLAGKQPEITETRQFGCSIKYEGGRKGAKRGRRGGRRGAGR